MKRRLRWMGERMIIGASGTALLGLIFTASGVPPDRPTTIIYEGTTVFLAAVAYWQNRTVRNCRIQMETLLEEAETLLIRQQAIGRMRENAENN